MMRDLAKKTEKTKEKWVSGQRIIFLRGEGVILMLRSRISRACPCIDEALFMMRKLAIV
jgi:hypothetical protein